jgi:hypothetical protein
MAEAFYGPWFADTPSMSRRINAAVTMLGILLLWVLLITPVAIIATVLYLVERQARAFLFAGPANRKRAVSR